MIHSRGTGGKYGARNGSAPFYRALYECKDFFSHMGAWTDGHAGLPEIGIAGALRTCKYDLVVLPDMSVKVKKVCATLYICAGRTTWMATLWGHKSFLQEGTQPNRGFFSVCLSPRWIKRRSSRATAKWIERV